MRPGILLICILTFVNSYGIDNDDTYYDTSGSGSGNIVNEKENSNGHNQNSNGHNQNSNGHNENSNGHNQNSNGRLAGSIIGGILGGSCVVLGLFLLGRRFCRNSYRLKKDDDYDYYAIMKRRYGSGSSYA